MNKLVSIVPLAGPNFFSANQCKALIPYKNNHLLNYILNTRKWANIVSYYIFILMDNQFSREFASQYLLVWYPDCKIVFITAVTRGAALSSSIGISLVEDFTSYLVIDLADIDYSVDLNPIDKFAADPFVGAVVPVFHSDKSCYSYIRLNVAGNFIRSEEKKVISQLASAGTYFFRDASTFLSSLVHSLENEAWLTHNDLFYVCPMLNGVQKLGLKVLPLNSNLICDLKFG